MGMLNRLMELLEDRKIFLRQRKTNKTKALALLIYHAGLSYRKTSAIVGCLEPFSYEALRKWYNKCENLFKPEKKTRRIVAIDETKLKKEKQQIYIWNALDINDKTILAVHISTSRTSFDAIYFLKMMLETCENKPLILVDRGPWYRWALQRLGLEYQHETFGWRTPIEQWYSLFKARVKRFWKRFPYRSTLISIKRWCTVWITMYNLFLEG
ncbi:MAG: IS6 family transposase, partial [Thermoplasmata archaeon]